MVALYWLWWTSDASYLTSKKMSSWWILLPIEKRSSGVKSRMSNSSFADMQKWVGCLKQRSLCGFLIYCYDRIFVIGRWISYSYKYYGDIVMLRRWWCCMVCVAYVCMWTIKWKCLLLRLEKILAKPHS